jgi:hypothetical protein
MRIELGLGEGNSRSLNACQKGSALTGIVPPFAPVVCGQIVLLFDQILVVLMVIVKTAADRVFDVEVDTVCRSRSAGRARLGERRLPPEGKRRWKGRSRLVCRMDYNIAVG